MCPFNVLAYLSFKTTTEAADTVHRQVKASVFHDLSVRLKSTIFLH